MVIYIIVINNIEGCVKVGRNKPNIIFIMMDDMGYGDVGCYGNTIIKTPVMDGIAEDGMRFTQMYSAPICSPARAQLMTGKYAQRVGIPRVLFPDDVCGIELKHKSIASYLKEQGYASMCIGKWHLGCCEEHFPTRHGFDRFYGLLYSNDMNPLHIYRDEKVEEYQVDQSTLTEKYTMEAIRFIKEHKERPFFCYLAHTMPHIPLHVPEEFRGKSVCGTYGDTIECIDFYIGKILQSLKEFNIDEETLLIVTSDNGPWYEGSTGNLRGRKFSVYEGGIRMPFIARWPGVIPAGAVCSETAHFMDMLPTFIKLADGNAVEGVDGKDISGLLEGKGKTPHEYLYFYFNESLNAVRYGKWKLVVADGSEINFPGSGNNMQIKDMPQLYDIDADPGESYNLADRHPELVSELINKMKEYDYSIQPIMNTQRRKGED